MARTDIQINVRIPELLKFRLEQAAKQSGLSLTAEIVERLQVSFPESILERLAESRREEADSLKKVIAKSVRMADRLKAVGATEDLERIEFTIRLYHELLDEIEAAQDRLRVKQLAYLSDNPTHKKPRAKRG